MTLEESPSFPACYPKTHKGHWDALMIKPLREDTADTLAEKRPDINKWCGTMNPWRLEAASERHLTVRVCDTGGRQWIEQEESRINTLLPATCCSLLFSLHPSQERTLSHTLPLLLPRIGNNMETTNDWDQGWVFGSILPLESRHSCIV